MKKKWPTVLGVVSLVMGAGMVFLASTLIGKNNLTWGLLFFGLGVAYFVLGFLFILSPKFGGKKAKRKATVQKKSKETLEEVSVTVLDEEPVEEAVEEPVEEAVEEPVEETPNESAEETIVLEDEPDEEKPNKESKAKAVLKFFNRVKENLKERLKPAEKEPEPETESFVAEEKMIDAFAIPETGNTTEVVEATSEEEPVEEMKPAEEVQPVEETKPVEEVEPMPQEQVTANWNQSLTFEEMMADLLGSSQVSEVSSTKEADDMLLEALNKLKSSGVVSDDSFKK